MRGKKIQLADRNSCTGCEACLNACAKGCITMVEDSEGFRFPKIDHSRCTSCTSCASSCPVLKPTRVKHDCEEVYAAIEKDEKIRMDSASGGVFYSFARTVINKGGVVFGVRWEGVKAVFSYAEDLESLKPFQGSKYVQAEVGRAHCQIRDFLKGGRIVLFCGTPCQVAGLKTFLKSEYENLYTISLICHSVSNQKVWGSFLTKKFPDAESIEKIVFRGKQQGWNYPTLTIDYIDKTGEKKHYEHYMFSSEYPKSFIRVNSSNRRSCYNCRWHINESMADLVIGDFWGIEQKHPDLFDDKGHSVIIVLTAHGKDLLQKAKDYMSISQSSMEMVLPRNPCLYSSIEIPENGRRKRFFFMFRFRKFLSIKTLYKKDWIHIRIWNSLIWHAKRIPFFKKH